MLSNNYLVKQTSRCNCPLHVKERHSSLVWEIKPLSSAFFQFIDHVLYWGSPVVEGRSISAKLEQAHYVHTVLLLVIHNNQAVNPVTTTSSSASIPYKQDDNVQQSLISPALNNVSGACLISLSSIFLSSIVLIDAQFSFTKRSVENKMALTKMQTSRL